MINDFELERLGSNNSSYVNNNDTLYYYHNDLTNTFNESNNNIFLEDDNIVPDRYLIELVRYCDYRDNKQSIEQETRNKFFQLDFNKFIISQKIIDELVIRDISFRVLQYPVTLDRVTAIITEDNNRQ